MGCFPRLAEEWIGILSPSISYSYVSTVEVSVGEIGKSSAEAVVVGELLSEGTSWGVPEVAVVAELCCRRRKGILMLGRRKVGK